MQKGSSMAGPPEQQSCQMSAKSMMDSAGASGGKREDDTINHLIMDDRQKSGSSVVGI